VSLRRIYKHVVPTALPAGITDAGDKHVAPTALGLKARVMITSSIF
jgi:hypothetical protein